MVKGWRCGFLIHDHNCLRIWWQSDVNSAGLYTRTWMLCRDRTMPTLPHMRYIWMASSTSMWTRQALPSSAQSAGLPPDLHRSQASWNLSKNTNVSDIFTTTESQNQHTELIFKRATTSLTLSCIIGHSAYFTSRSISKRNSSGGSAFVMSLTTALTSWARWPGRAACWAEVLTMCQRSVWERSGCSGGRHWFYRSPSDRWAPRYTGAMVSEKRAARCSLPTPPADLDDRHGSAKF